MGSETARPQSKLQRQVFGDGDDGMISINWVVGLGFVFFILGIFIGNAVGPIQLQAPPNTYPITYVVGTIRRSVEKNLTQYGDDPTDYQLKLMGDEAEDIWGQHNGREVSFEGTVTNVDGDGKYVRVRIQVPLPGDEDFNINLTKVPKAYLPALYKGQRIEGWGVLQEICYWCFTDTVYIRWKGWELPSD